MMDAKKEVKIIKKESTEQEREEARRFVGKKEADTIFVEFRTSDLKRWRPNIVIEDLYLEDEE